MDLNSALEELHETRIRLIESWKRANRASIESDSKMQSRYDTRKEEFAARANMIQTQINRVERLISCLRNLQRPEDVAHVQIGHIVRIRIENDDPISILLLEDQGGKVLNGTQLISIKSPLGKALLGRKPGEKVTYQGPAGTIEAHILAVIS